MVRRMHEPRQIPLHQRPGKPQTTLRPWQEVQTAEHAYVIINQLSIQKFTLKNYNFIELIWIYIALKTVLEVRPKKR